MPTNTTFFIRSAVPADVGLLLKFIRELADYERLSHLVVATEELLLTTVFGPGSNVKVVFVCEKHGDADRAVGVALYFYNFSTFLGRPGIYLEDLFVQPDARGKGYGKALMVHLAQVAVAEGCGRFEWSVLDWNEPSIAFYRSIGAVGMDEWRIQRLTGDALVALANAPEKLP